MTVVCPAAGVLNASILGYSGDGINGLIAAQRPTVGRFSEGPVAPAEEGLTQGGLDELERLLDQMRDARRAYLEYAATLLS